MRENVWAEKTDFLHLRTQMRILKDKFNWKFLLLPRTRVRRFLKKINTQEMTK